MINYLSGSVLSLNQKSITLLTSCGIGYEVFVCQEILQQETRFNESKLWIHHVIREDAQELYGFLEQSDVFLFKLLVSVSGVGPKSALSLFDLLPGNLLVNAIQNKDNVSLSRASGIGKKTAEKIALELHDKLDSFGNKSEHHFASSELSQILRDMGYSEKAIFEALSKLPETKDIPLEVLVKQALKLLAK
jgi:holliday junction DNA helicase RuvA